MMRFLADKLLQLCAWLALRHELRRANRTIRRAQPRDPIQRAREAGL